MLKRLLKIKVKQPDNTSVRIFIKPQTYAVEQKLRVVYAQMYRKLVDEQVATRSSMLDLLKREGIWTDKEEEKTNELLVELALLETALENTSKEEQSKQRELVIKMSKTRSQLLELVQVKTEPLEFVAESIAEEIKVEHYIVESTFYEDGKQYFKSYDDFKSRRYDEDVIKICDNFMRAINMSNTRILLDLPENKWLVNHGFMDKTGNVTDEELWKELEGEIEDVVPIVEEIKPALTVEETNKS